jgi:hypothetical protein
MKHLILITILFFSNVQLATASSGDGVKPLYNKVYRTARIGDSYHFLLLNESGKYYHLFTNKTDKLSASELKSSNLLNILEKKQAWGKAFPKQGDYTVNKGKLYTKLLWNPIKVITPNKIKYLNKTFYLK